MSLENKKKTPESETPETPEALSQKKSPAGSKPVIIYIMILFIAAFLLMALSFLMHQRSNTETLGSLQNFVTAMQEVQDYQDKIIDLQDQLAEAEDALESQAKTSEEDLVAKQEELNQQSKVLEAMTDLYRLQQAYSNEDYDACQEMIRHMEASGSVNHLPTEVTEAPEVTSPYDRYTQFKEAVVAIRTLSD